MTVLRVIVDELPVKASRCDAVQIGYTGAEWQVRVWCKYKNDSFKNNPQIISRRDFVTTRCPDCPLALENDNTMIEQLVEAGEVLSKMVGEGGGVRPESEYEDALYEWNKVSNKWQSMKDGEA